MPPRRGRSSQLTRGAAGAGKGLRGWGSSRGAPSDGDPPAQALGRAGSSHRGSGRRKAAEWRDGGLSLWSSQLPAPVAPGLNIQSKGLQRRGEEQSALPRRWLRPVCCPGEQGLLAAPMPLAQGGQVYHASYNMLMLFLVPRFPGSILEGHVAKLLAVQL